MKILYVTTLSMTIDAFLIPHIELLQNLGHQVDIATNLSDKGLDSYQELWGSKFFDIPFSRSPIQKDNIRAYQKLKKIIKYEEYDIVHTHTPVASAITRLVCRHLPNTKVYYTAHGFHFFKDSPRLNWFTYYPIEKYLSNYTDTLITINHEDYQLASNRFLAKRNILLPGVGLKVNDFSQIEVDTVKKSEELGLKPDTFIILSIGELNANKNHSLVLQALSLIENKQIEYVVCGSGPLKSELIEQAKELGLEGKAHFLGTRNDVAEIFKVANLYIHPSKREGLPVALMEAMASGLPIVCSDIRGNNDLLQDGDGGYLFESDNLVDLVDQLKKILSEQEKYASFAQFNQTYVKRYSLENVLEELEKVYE